MGSAHGFGHVELLEDMPGYGIRCRCGQLWGARTLFGAWIALRRHARRRRRYSRP